MRRFPATLDAIPPATAWARDRARDLGIDDEISYALQVCVEELASNSVRHGKRMSHGWFAIAVASDIRAVTLRFLDDAEAFDITKAEAHKVDKPLDDLTPGGLGIGLVKSLAETCSYERDGLTNVITLQFVRRSARDGVG